METDNQESEWSDFKSEADEKGFEVREPFGLNFPFKIPQEIIDLPNDSGSESGDDDMNTSDVGELPDSNPVPKQTRNLPLSHVSSAVSKLQTPENVILFKNKFSGEDQGSRETPTIRPKSKGGFIRNKFAEK